jgi:hypothetical protein
MSSISSAVEGFAFSYKGVIYKFTGKFAPVNQILGLSKYGRGSKKGSEELDEQQGPTSTFDIALLGGGIGDVAPLIDLVLWFPRRDDRLRPDARFLAGCP